MIAANKETDDILCDTRFCLLKSVLGSTLNLMLYKTGLIKLFARRFNAD